jgi:quercetin dioxygenase-like cupin family protein
MRSISAVAIVSSLALTAAARAQAPAIKWGPAPAVLPAGVRMAVLAGDPGQPGQFTVRLELPAGTRVLPHFHPTDEYITVISGTFLVGMGDSLDVAKSTVLPTGAFVTVGANMHHYASVRARTVVQISSMGPFVLTYVHPQDQPQTGATK